jgi:predicted amidohydrolase
MRKFKLGTIALRKTDEARDPSNRIKNREERFSEAEPFITQAGRENVDFLCLPEIFSIAGMEANIESLAENLPGGPTSNFCSNIAKKNNLNLITSIRRKKGNKTYNTAVIFNRKGKIAGLYNKVHPAPEENITKGNDFPVFNIEGLKIGLQLCYDLTFPEGCRILALRGTEVIFWPTMWDGPLAHFVDCTIRARAMENLITLVSSSYVYYGAGSWKTHKSIAPTAIISWNGFILSQTGINTGLATTEIDFDELKNLQGDKKTIFQNRRPELYKEICKKF